MGGSLLKVLKGTKENDFGRQTGLLCSQLEGGHKLIFGHKCSMKSLHAEGVLSFWWEPEARMPEHVTIAQSKVLPLLLTL